MLHNEVGVCTHSRLMSGLAPPVLYMSKCNKPVPGVRTAIRSELAVLRQWERAMPLATCCCTIVKWSHSLHGPFNLITIVVRDPAARDKPAASLLQNLKGLACCYEEEHAVNSSEH